MTLYHVLKDIWKDVEHPFKENYLIFQLNIFQILLINFANLVQIEKVCILFSTATHWKLKTYLKLIFTLLDFLKHSPCMNEKVLMKPSYKEKCSNSFLATIEKTHEVKALDDRLDTVCCSFNRWQNCLFRLIWFYYFFFLNFEKNENFQDRPKIRSAFFNKLFFF